VANSYWKTKTSPERRELVKRPTGSQVLRQLGVALLIVALWGIAFGAYLNLTLEEETAAATAPPDSAAVAGAPTGTPTATATLSPVASAAPTDSATAAEPSATSDGSPTHTPPATETPAPPIATAPLAPTATEPSATDTPTVAPTEAVQVSFAGDVLPIFQNRCVKCHGGERTEEGLVLATYDDVMAGSFSGPVVVPGYAEDSYLVEQIVSGEMPKRAPRLLPGEIQFIVDWVNGGAPDN
jgi:hypothetical protein